MKVQVVLVVVVVLAQVAGIWVAIALVPLVVITGLGPVILVAVVVVVVTHTLLPVPHFPTLLRRNKVLVSRLEVIFTRAKTFPGTTQTSLVINSMMI